MDIKEKLHMHWVRLMLMLGLNKNSGILLFDMIFEKYSKEQRKFHNASLLLSMLDEYKNFHGQDPAIYFAIWFIHYSTRRTEKARIIDTEEIIHLTFRTLSIDRNYSEKSLGLFRSLFLNNPNTFEEKIIRDLSLLYLSKDSNSFIKDRKSLKSYYPSMSDYLFNCFLSNSYRRILNKGSVYYTIPFIEKNEKMARENINAYI